ncbi:hypothetical protein EAT51_07875 [Pseudoxanthomonas winnipegensis]|nr:hypothetical protein [Pseudoxanthomonas winnipegensis]RZZ81956.1 hypothetical protein EA662_17450 [Pseudoxanthomonas winnipegensis]TAA42178.1 hypothetical protein EAT51_07875 [Pseudoxanthomonas winnipegensis]
MLASCASVPANLKGQTHVELDSHVAYDEAYRIVARQMRACYRVIGIFGNGFDIQSDLDTQAKQGRIELYFVGVTGAKPDSDSKIPRTVTISQLGTGSHIVIQGNGDRYVYYTSQGIRGWLDGSNKCNGK